MSNSPIFDSVITDVSDVKPILATKPPTAGEILQQYGAKQARAIPMQGGKPAEG